MYGVLSYMDICTNLYMEIKERIRKIIENEGLSQADFSRITGINTSTLSHVLTGRNNPSIEVINKILTAFPQYNSQWLVNGEGTAKNESLGGEPRSTESIDGVHKTPQYSLFGAVQNDYTPNFPMNYLEADKFGSTSKVDDNQMLHTQDSMSSSHVAPKVIQLPAQKIKVNKIIVYYEDGTFECFIPEKE